MCNSPALFLNVSLLPKEARDDHDWWADRLGPILGLKRGITEALNRVVEQAHREGNPVSFKAAERRFYQARRKGPLGLIDRRLAGPQYWQLRKPAGLSEQDRELVKLYCGRNQRGSRSAIKQLQVDYSRGKVQTETPRDPRTGLPRGWTLRNLQKHAPTKYQLKAVRIGRSAAKADRPLVYTTRAGLWKCSHISFDDKWHDFEINSFREKQAGRALEIASRDLFTAKKIQWGIRPRTKKDDGTNNGLTERMTRMIFAATLFLDGYSPRGTICLSEHGTAVIDEDLARKISDHTGGLVTVSYSGWEGKAAHDGQYPGIHRGNYRFKASHESHHNLEHNVLGDFPGQVGKDRQHCPEEHAAMMKHNLALLRAWDQLPEHERDQIIFPIFEENQAIEAMRQRYEQIDHDTDHSLEGWEKCGHVVQELYFGERWVNQFELLGGDPAHAALALEMVRAGTLETRPRRMSRHEAWVCGGDLIRLPAWGVYDILEDLEQERKVRDEMFEFQDRELGPGDHRFFASATGPQGEEIKLRNGETYRTLVNPYAPDSLMVRRDNGAWIGECKRMTAPCRADAEAVHRAMGAAQKYEAALLAPLQLRHLADAKKKAAMHLGNAALLAAPNGSPRPRPVVLAPGQEAEVWEPAPPDPRPQQEEEVW